MALLEDILKELGLLTEISTQNDQMIIDAIKKMRRVRIVYNDQEHDYRGKRTRYILPVAYGISKSGNPVIRAFQTAGSTKRGNGKWKFFRLDRIISWSNSTRSFKRFAEFLKSQNLNLNWDDGMTKIFALSPICNQNNLIPQTTNPIDDKPITPNDVTPSVNIGRKEGTKEIPQQQNYNSQQATNIDNKPQPNYNLDRLTAPDTKPISQDDIEGKSTQSQQVKLQPTNQQQQPSQTAPVSQSDIEQQTPNSEGSNETDKSSENMLTQSFKDMMNRMDNLYRDDDEKDNDLNNR